MQISCGIFSSLHGMSVIHGASFSIHVNSPLTNSESILQENTPISLQARFSIYNTKLRKNVGSLNVEIQN